jgi:very-short-patch-repair endonuclease
MVQNMAPISPLGGRCRLFGDRGGIFSIALCKQENFIQLQFMSGKHNPVPTIQLGRARNMRREMTQAELKLWNELRAHRLMGLSFRRQHPIGPFIVDFACVAFRFIVELDGSHHADDSAVLRDIKRTQFLESQGWHVLRFWNDDVLNDIDNVCQHIWIECESRKNGG